MKRAYGGVEIEIAYNVHFVTFDEPVPVFHRFGEVRGGCSAWATVTGCGEILHYDPCDDAPTDRDTVLPAQHAVLFGRPCKTCWPQLRAQRSLFARPKRPRRETVDQEALL